jgi:Icc-related predicted phosphoesterase
MHPAGSKSEFSGFPGSKAITKAIKQFKPDFVLHGHIHEASGIEEKVGNTKIINISREGKILEI